MKSALFSGFGENFRPLWRFWELWRSQMRFGQNVLAMTWKERFVQFLWKAHCFPLLARISGQCDDFENFDGQKSDLAKTCCAWPEKSVLYNFYRKRTVFPFWKEGFVQVLGKEHSFPVLARIWGQCDDFENFDAQKCALAKTCCALTLQECFVQFSWKARCFPVLARISGQCNDFENFDPQKCDLAKTCCAWPEKSLFIQFSWRAHCFPVLKRISIQCDDFENFAAQKCDLAKTCFAWPEKSVLYNFHLKRTVFPFWREFQASVTILRAFPLKNGIWLKRAAHDLKRALFWQNLIKAVCFGQIAFLNVKVLKSVTLAWNFLQKGTTVRFSLKWYQTLFSGHAEHVLAKSHFWQWKFSKS